MDAPLHLEVQKDRGLRVQWPDGSWSFYPVAYLRRLSPSADMRHLRERMSRNPLTVLPASSASGSGALTITHAELVGHYAIKIVFSDGHSSGIYSWEYLRSIAPAPEDAPPPRDPTPGP
ncbi:MAG: DUF971 domain-containing protein [Phycisphaeraceae bacterium]|nr:DUF971 domain-containing protein [Phycisphaerae bacterium]MBX3392423.1 DUF971 domain-containing protein [Phycisphaeraceae bacterium]